MLKTYLGLFTIAVTTLLLELLLIRVFDVILFSNISYMIITAALFCFGLAGIYTTMKPIKKSKSINIYLAKLSLLFALFAILILPVMNFIPFNFENIADEPLSQAIYFILMYLFVAIPFFIAGLVFTNIFSSFSDKITSLYFWDLVGAAIGCIIIIPLIPDFGSGGVLFVVAGLALLSSGLFSKNNRYLAITLIAAIALIVFPTFLESNFEFNEHVNKRGVLSAKQNDKVEFSYWDPVSKIDIIDQNNKKHIAYDGGSQSSHIFKFDGDFQKLKSQLPDSVLNSFWNRGVLASHYFKQDTDQKVLIIGSAAGQETKAALTYGASHIDAIEMVSKVVDLGKDRYSEYNGNIFNHKNVNVVAGEGRSFLRATEQKYDIIQIYSNHTSSSMAAGTGAMATTYLQTSEAYKEYINHLNDDGILHINHHIYPRMVTTASLAWKELGYNDFAKHLLVICMKEKLDYLPTFLLKKSEWTEKEYLSIKAFFDLPSNETWEYMVVSNPLNSKSNYLPGEFYTGNFPEKLSETAGYNIWPTTDNRPYFNFLRKTNSKLEIDSTRFIDHSVKALLNNQLRANIIPLDSVHFYIVGILSAIFSILFIILPLSLSKTGKSKNWIHIKSTLLYFSCLGMGFIIFELVFIQIFMKFIGFPLYTYSTIVFIILFSAGNGSYFSPKLGISLKAKWFLPFIGIIFSSLFILISHDYIFDIFLSTQLAIRILVSSLLIFPLGFFLGMPFPLGIKTLIKQPKGAIAWAWGMNGLFTVIGGLLSALFSIFYGFNETIIVAIVVYIVAFFTFSKIRLSDVN